MKKNAKPLNRAEVKSKPSNDQLNKANKDLAIALKASDQINKELINTHLKEASEDAIRITLMASEIKDHGELIHAMEKELKVSRGYHKAFIGSELVLMAVSLFLGFKLFTSDSHILGVALIGFGSWSVYKAVKAYQSLKH